MPVTTSDVEAAYQALGTGDSSQIAQWWHQDLRWLVPGNHQLAGWWQGLDGFLEFMGRVGQLSGGSFQMTRTAVLLGEDSSADVSHNVGSLTGAPPRARDVYSHLDINVIHLLRWRHGKVVEGRGAIFGDGTSQFNQFWSQVRHDGTRAG